MSGRPAIVKRWPSQEDPEAWSPYRGPADPRHAAQDATATRTPFAEPATVSGQGDLAAGHSIPRSLILKEGGARPATDGVWQHELQIR